MYHLPSLLTTDEDSRARLLIHVRRLVLEERVRELAANSIESAAILQRVREVSDDSNQSYIGFERFHDLVKQYILLELARQVSDTQRGVF